MNQNKDTTDPDMDYYLNEELCDVVFLVEGHRIPAPKQFLTVKSRVFRAMFSGKYKESEDNAIAIEDTTADAFKTFIRFIISEELVFSDDNDFEVIFQVLRLSDKYEVRRLFNKVMDFIKPRVNLQNLRSFTRIAFKYKLDQLMTIFIEFINNNINVVILRDIEELSEINDCTNDLLFDLVTSGRTYAPSYFRVPAGNYLYVSPAAFARGNFPFSYYGEMKIEGSFEALKVLIGFLYFNRLIIKDKNDFKLIREVIEIGHKYSVGLLMAISADLQNRISYEDIEQILKLIIDFEIKDLIEKVLEFIETNIEVLVKMGVEKLETEPSSDLILIRDIFKIIQKYKLSDELIEGMAALLGKRITFDNLFIVYKLAVDYDIEDLKANIKIFMDKNLKLISGKDMKDLIEMNNAMNNTLLEVLIKHLANN